MPASLLDNWEGLGREVELFTHLHVRENELSLYGCGSQEELAVFELLLRLLPSIIGGHGLCRNSGESRPTN